MANDLHTHTRQGNNWFKNAFKALTHTDTHIQPKFDKIENMWLYLYYKCCSVGENFVLVLFEILEKIPMQLKVHTHWKGRGLIDCWEEKLID